MASERLYCDHCGALCSRSDIFCKSCFTKLVQEPTEEPQVIEGIDNKDLEAFLEKNVHYYMDSFAEKEGKKHFFQFNWAAFLFGSNWFLYRGMFKIVIIYLICCSILTAFLFTGIALLYNADFANYRSASEAVSEYRQSGGKTLIFHSSGRVETVPEYARLYDAEKKARDSFIIMCIVLVLVVIAAEVLFRLSANCIYRNHIIKNIGRSKGGASIVTMIGGIILINLIEHGFDILVILITGINNIIKP